MTEARRWSTTQGERGYRLGERKRERGLCASVDHSFYARCNQGAPPLFFKKSGYDAAINFLSVLAK
jgi:hypothetical protein